MPESMITDEMVERFARYYKAEPMWGSLHVVMDDGNWATSCVGWAEAVGDIEGAELARILVGLSGSARYKLRRRAEERRRGFD